MSTASNHQILKELQYGHAIRPKHIYAINAGKDTIYAIVAPFITCYYPSVPMTSDEVIYCTAYSGQIYVVTQSQIILYDAEYHIIKAQSESYINAATMVNDSLYYSTNSQIIKLDERKVIHHSKAYLLTYLEQLVAVASQCIAIFNKDNQILNTIQCFDIDAIIAHSVYSNCFILLQSDGIVYQYDPKNEIIHRFIISGCTYLNDGILICSQNIYCYDGMQLKLLQVNQQIPDKIVAACKNGLDICLCTNKCLYTIRKLYDSYSFNSILHYEFASISMHGLALYGISKPHMLICYDTVIKLAGKQCYHSKERMPRRRSSRYGTNGTSFDNCNHKANIFVQSSQITIQQSTSRINSCYT